MSKTGQQIKTDELPADCDRLRGETEVFSKGEIVCAGAGLCIVVHRSLAVSRGVNDCARQAIAAGITTDLINSDEGRPKRLLADEPRDL